MSKRLRLPSRLPCELVEEILVRVRAKDLVRFRCVCKSWRLLFQDERFITKHRNHARARFISLHITESPVCHFFHEIDKPETILDLSVADISWLSECWIIGHCNGLFCLQLYDKHDSIGIWNPSLRELRRMHIPKWCEIGFGYDHSTQDYKIVLAGSSSSSSKAQVLSLKSGVSRMIDFPSPDNFVMGDMPNNSGTLMGQYIYWLVYDDIDLKLAETILRFDLVSETFNYFPGPPICGCVALDVLRGCLCTVGTEQGNSGSEIVIWSAQHQVANHGAVKSWTKILTLSLAFFVSLTSPRVRHCWLVSAFTHAGLLVFVVALLGERKMFSYNLEDKNGPRSLETNLSLEQCGHVQMYFETLVPVPGAAFAP